MTLAFVRYCLRYDNYRRNLRLIILNTILVVCVMLSLILLSLGYKQLAQVSMVISLIALFLNRPRDLFMPRRGRPTKPTPEAEEQPILIQTQ